MSRRGGGVHGFWFTVSRPIGSGERRVQFWASTRQEAAAVAIAWCRATGHVLLQPPPKARREEAA